MINFRYHVVSLTAVFLALAVGLILGTAALNGTVTDNLNDQVSSLRKSNEALRGQVNQLDSEANRKEDFDRRMAPAALNGTLANRRVLTLALPGADSSQIDGVNQMLGYAGAKSTGTVQLSGTFIDPGHADALSDMVNRHLPVDVKGIPNNGDGVESSSALLAAVLLDRKNQPAVSADSRTAVLSAFETTRDLNESTKVSGPAEAVVIVAGPPATDRDAAKRNAALLTLVKQFGAAGATVVAGPGTAGDGNVIAAVRGDGTLSKSVSTVDTLNLVQGQITVALALPSEIAGKAGHYGTGDNAQDLMPKGAS